MMMRGGNYKNPCLTMHQPWASLLVYGIKRIEGRSWPAPIRGRLWIHAASKVPDEATIKAMEEFYQEIYAVNGITDIQFPQHYPVSRLIGCVEVVGCVSCEELQSWEALPEGVRLEGQTNFCWLCEQPQKLIIPFEMRGYQGVYNLEKKVYEGAARGLMPSKSPFPVKFPLPDPKDPFSLKPGSISCTIEKKKPLKMDQHTSLTAAIAGARAAATQFSNKGQSLAKNNIREHETRSKNKDIKEDAKSIDNTGNGSSGTAGVEAAAADDSTCITRSKQMSEAECSGSSSSKVEDDTKLTRNYNVEVSKRSVDIKREEKNRSFDPGAARIMAAAFRNLKPSS